MFPEGNKLFVQLFFLDVLLILGIHLAGLGAHMVKVPALHVFQLQF